MSDRPFLTTGQVAERIGLCERSVRRGIVRGELPGTRVGKRYVIPAAAFDAFMRGEWTPRHSPHAAPQMIHSVASKRREGVA